MKRFAFSLFVASITMNTASVLAEVAPLTTQGYVDDGLRAVYRALDEKKADADVVYTATETDDIFATKNELIGLYQAEENGGIAIDENNKVSLDITEPEQDAVYMFRNGTWTAYSVNSDFSSAFENNDNEDEENI